MLATVRIVAELGSFDRIRQVAYNEYVLLSKIWWESTK